MPMALYYTVAGHTDIITLAETENAQKQLWRMDTLTPCIYNTPFRPQLLQVVAIMAVY